jgi:putative DNA primase/helicase
MAWPRRLRRYYHSSLGALPSKRLGKFLIDELLSGFEGDFRCALRTDTVLLLDVIDLADPRELDQAVYILVNGYGKSRANRFGAARSSAHWRVFLLSSGEKTVDARLFGAGINSNAGQTLRLLDVATEGEYGAFDCLHGFSNGALFADSLRDAATHLYGHAGPEFLRALIAAKAVGLDAGQRVRDALCSFNSSNEQERRAARVFALVGVAGELAIKFGLVPWETGSAHKAAVLLFERWQENRQSVVPSGNSEHSAILRTIDDFINRHGESRFSNVDPVPGELEHAPLVRDRAGYWEDTAGKRIYLFTTTGLKDAAKGYHFPRVLKALDDAGAFTCKDTKQRSVVRRTPDNRTVLAGGGV